MKKVVEEMMVEGDEEMQNFQQFSKLKYPSDKFVVCSFLPAGHPRQPAWRSE